MSPVFKIQKKKKMKVICYLQMPYNFLFQLKARILPFPLPKATLRYITILNLFAFLVLNVLKLT